MSTDQNNILEKVKKLFAKAEGTTNENEADIFLKKANELLIKYNLDIADISDGFDKDVFQSDPNGIFIGQVKEEGQWEQILMSTICEFNLCDSITHTNKLRKTKTMSVIGKKENVEMVVYMFTVAREMIRATSKVRYNAHRNQVVTQYPGYSDLELQKANMMGYRMPWIRSYLKAACVGLYHKLDEQRNELIQQMTNANEYGLMVVGNKDAIIEYKEAKYGDDLGKARNTSNKVNDKYGAASLGLKDGKNINLNKAVDSGRVHKAITL